ncbi:MAG: YadA-like family protein [Pyramidobacter sp.]|nr:YadA-like family protein [Pyramidobacter sp.]
MKCKALFYLVLLFALAASLAALPAKAAIQINGGTPGTSGNILIYNDDVTDAATKSQAFGGGAIAIGSKAGATSAGAAAIGYQATAYAEGALAVGKSSTVLAGAENAIALGIGAFAEKSGSIAIGAYSHANEENTVSVGAAGDFQRRIVNVAAGTSASDAATYGQLSAVDAKIAQNTTDIGTLKIETSALRVDVDTNGRHIAENRNTIAANAAEIGKIGAVLGTDYANPAFSTLRVGGMSYAGSTLSMGGGRITGLAPGRISADSTDAVTGSQLYQVHRGMGELQESVKIVGAHAAALSGLHPIQYDPGAPTTLSAAFGTYRDEYALALGVFHYARENVMFNLGASLNTDGEVMGRAGISIALGKSAPKPDTQDMSDVQKQMAQMQAMLIELKAQNDRNQLTIARNERTIESLTRQLSSR